MKKTLTDPSRMPQGRRKRIVGARISREAYEALSARAERSKMSFYEYASSVLETAARSPVTLGSDVKTFGSSADVPLDISDMVKVYKTSRASAKDETDPTLLE